MQRIFHYEKSFSLLAPVVKFLLRGLWGTWIGSIILLALFFYLLFGNTGLLVGGAIGVLICPALIFAICMSVIRTDMKIELSDSHVKLCRGIYEKEISWDSVIAVNEMDSLIWKGLLQIVGEHETITINLPLIENCYELLSEVRSRVPDSIKVNGTWANIGSA